MRRTQTAAALPTPTPAAPKLPPPYLPPAPDARRVCANPNPNPTPHPNPDPDPTPNLAVIERWAYEVLNDFETNALKMDPDAPIELAWAIEPVRPP